MIFRGGRGGTLKILELFLKTLLQDLCSTGKKDYVSKIINPQNILSFKGYDYLTENNSIKARTGMYINNLIPYQRRTDLEKMDCGIIIVDVQLIRFNGSFESFKIKCKQLLL